jgi:prepilin-type N-terminal cleavage/methylation domain-containing protein
MHAAKTTPTAHARRGFTLIELLIVIAIIAVLAALAMAVVGAVATNQQIKGTNQTLQKLSTILNQQWKAVIDQAKDEIRTGQTNNQQFLALTQNWKPDDTKNLWIQLRLAQEFPTSFTEAKTGVTYQSVSLSAKPYYRQALRGVSATGQPFESSACLFLALSPGRRGMVGSIEESVAASSIRSVTQQGDTGSAKVLVDFWGTPIAYVRGNEYNISPTPPDPNKYPVLISSGPNMTFENGGGDDITSLVVNISGARGG